MILSKFLLCKGIQRPSGLWDFVSEQDIIDFTEYHVKKALENAYKKAKPLREKGSDDIIEWLDKDSILNSYPLKNIK